MSHASSICACIPSTRCVDSVVRIDELVEAVAAAGMPAVALTDQCNLFAMVKFYRAALARGRQADHRRGPAAARAGRARRADPRCVLLCQDAGGLPQPDAAGDRAPTWKASSAAVPLVAARAG